MSLSNLSMTSFKAPGALGNNRSFIMKNASDKPMNYYYKMLQQDTNIVIKTPQDIVTDISGDKQIHFRYISIYDPIFSNNSSTNKLYQRVRVTARNQRNNYDASGVQTQIIGYLQFDNIQNIIRGECQPFEMDGRLDTKIAFEYFDQSTGNWLPLNLSSVTNNIYPYVYLDCEIQYDLNDF